MTYQWTFIIAAYALTLLATGIVTIVSWRTMRDAETRVDEKAGHR